MPIIVANKIWLIEPLAQWLVAVVYDDDDDEISLISFPHFGKTKDEI